MNIYPISYKLNHNNVDLFIKTSDTSVEDALKKFIKSTIHISYENFMRLFNKNLKYFINNYISSNNRPLFIYIDTSGKNDYTHKSNYWLYMYVKNFINKFHENIKIEFIDTLKIDNIQDGDNIMLIDDCIYSGGQMSSTIRGMKSIHKNLNILLLVSFISEKGLSKIKESFYRSTQSNNLILAHDIQYIYPITNFLSNQEIDNLFSFYNISNASEHPRYAVYFDHKLADNESSYPEIYSGIVPNNKNKMLLKELKQNKIKSYNPMYTKQKSKLEQEKINLEKQLDIYPLLENCEHIRNIDMMKPQCPHPPYKEGYNSFIRKIKLSTKHSSYSKRSRKYRTNSIRLKTI